MQNNIFFTEGANTPIDHQGGGSALHPQLRFNCLQNHYVPLQPSHCGGYKHKYWQVLWLICPAAVFLKYVWGLLYDMI